MQMNERQKKIIEILEALDEVEVNYLTQQLEASEATIRRDLNTLQHEGMLVRTIGGARRINLLFRPSPEMEARKKIMFLAKKKIAECAAQYIQSGITIALDNSSTVWFLLRHLKSIQAATVVTNSIEYIKELGSNPEITILMVGGQFRQMQRDFTGPKVMRGLQEWHADICFLGADSLRPGKGIYKIDQQDASIAGAISEASDKSIILLDHTKINGSGSALAVPTKNIDILITDSNIDFRDKRLLIESEPYILNIV